MDDEAAGRAHSDAAAATTSETGSLPPGAVVPSSSSSGLDSDAAGDEDGSGDFLSSSPLKVLGSGGLYLAPSRPYSARFVHFFPAPSVRVWAVLCFLAAVGSTLAFLVITVESKWLRDVRSPATQVSSEGVDQIPAIRGQLTLFSGNFWWNQSLVNSVQTVPGLGSDGATDAFLLNPATPLPTYTPPRPVPFTPQLNGYSWHEVYIEGVKTSWDPATHESNGGTPRSTGAYGCASTLSVIPAPYPMEFCVSENHSDQLYGDGSAPWPLLLNSTQQRVCLRSYRLLDTRAMVEVSYRLGNGSADTPHMLSFNRMRYGVPVLYLTLMDLTELRVAVRDNWAMTRRAQTELIASLLPLAYNTAHSIRLKMTKDYPLEGDAEWHTELQYAGGLRFEPTGGSGDPLSIGMVDEAFAEYFRLAPEFHARLQSDPNLELNSSAPNATRRFYMETCFSPASFQVGTIRLQRTYGAFNFLSDVGGQGASTRR